MMIATDVLNDIARKYKTPTYVFDEDEVGERAGAIRDILNNGNNGNAIDICYSVKANPFLINALTGIVDRFEVCSPGELEICRSLDVPGECIIYSGVHKETEDITEAIRYGCGVITAESLRHYELICDAAAREGATVNVILRLNGGSQFGMSREDICSILSDAGRCEGVTVTGIHYFVGTQRVKLKKQKEELEHLYDLIAGWEKEYGRALPHFEYGPGFAYPYFEGDDFTDTLAPARELAQDLQRMAGSRRVTVEMGRFIASSCGYYLTSVADLKKANGHNWCILDGGINHVNYLGQMMGMKVPVIIYIPREGSDRSEDGSYTLCGSLCTTADVLVRDMKLTAPAIGDVLVFCNIGAYSVTEGIYLFLSRDMPKVVMYRDGTPTPVRHTINTWKLNVVRSDG